MLGAFSYARDRTDVLLRPSAICLRTKPLGRSTKSISVAFHSLAVCLNDMPGSQSGKWRTDSHISYNTPKGVCQRHDFLQ